MTWSRSSFPSLCVPGKRLSLHFVYGGEVLSEAGAGLLYVGARGTWYPNRGLEMARFDLQFRYPAGWTLVATGKRLEGEAQLRSAARGRSRAIGFRTVPCRLPGLTWASTRGWRRSAGKVQVEAYAASGVERSFPARYDRGAWLAATAGSLSACHATDEVTDRPRLRLLPRAMRRRSRILSARAVEFFARRFGPYPYSSLALTQMPGDVSQGWPSLIFLSSFSFLTPQEKSQLHMSPVAKILSDNVIAHETAHQWWGDLVSWKSYRDQWLFEALANYSALLLLESDSPQQFHAVMEKYREDLLVKNKEGSPLADAGPVTFGTRLNCSHFPEGYEAISYGRGTWLFHMLRYMLRDADRKSSGRSAELSDAQADAPFLRALNKVQRTLSGKGHQYPRAASGVRRRIASVAALRGKQIAGLVLRGMDQWHGASSSEIAVREVSAKARELRWSRAR